MLMSKDEKVKRPTSHLLIRLVVIRGSNFPASWLSDNQVKVTRTVALYTYIYYNMKLVHIWNDEEIFLDFVNGARARA